MPSILKKISIETSILAIILIASIGLRITYFNQAKESKLLRYNISLGTDMSGFHNWGTLISEGDWLSKKKGVLFQPPTYPYFLGIIYTIFGANFLIAGCVQSIFGTLLVVIIYLITKKLFKTPLTSLFAAALTGFYPVLIYYEFLLQRTSIATFFYALLLLLIVYSNENPNKKKFFFSGILSGIIVLIEPQFLLFMPIIFLYYYLYHKKNIYYPLFFTLGVLLIIFPVSLRNLYFGKFVLISSNGPVTWLAGNSYDSTGWYLEPKKGSMPVLSLDFFKLQLRKLFLWFSSYEIPNNTNYYQFKEHIPILKLNKLSYGFLVPFGLTGLILCKKHFKRLLFLYVFITVYTMSTAIFMSLSRFRLPIVPILIIFSSYTISWIYKQATSGEYKNIFFVAVPIIALFIVFKVPGNFLLVQSQYNANLGNLFFAGKKYSRAAIEYEKALSSKDANNPSIYLPLGETYLKLGKLNHAIVSFLQYLSFYPNKHKIKKNLGFLYKSKNDYSKATHYFNLYLKSIENNPKEKGLIINEINSIRDHL